MVTAAGAPGVTVTVTAVLSAPEVAEIAVTPLTLPVINPVLLMVATSLLLLDQWTSVAGVLPDALTIVAVA